MGQDTLYYFKKVMETLNLSIYNLPVLNFRHFANQSEMVNFIKEVLLLVQLESGVLVNLEIQKVGYDFPGQRSACDSSDLVMREYSRLKSQKHKRFSYQAIGKVITIVVIENSSRAFHQADGGFVHHFKQRSDTSLELVTVHSVNNNTLCDAQKRKRCRFAPQSSGFL